MFYMHGSKYVLKNYLDLKKKISEFFWKDVEIFALIS